MVPWSTYSLIKNSEYFTVDGIQFVASEQKFAGGVKYGYPGTKVYDQKKISIWEMHISKDENNCTYDLEIV
jgi:hypothetical protein